MCASLHETNGPVPRGATLRGRDTSPSVAWDAGSGLSRRVGLGTRACGTIGNRRSGTASHSVWGAADTLPIPIDVRLGPKRRSGMAPRPGGGRPGRTQNLGEGPGVVNPLPEGPDLCGDVPQALERCPAHDHPLLGAGQFPARLINSSRSWGVPFCLFHKRFPDEEFNISRAERRQCGDPVAITTGYSHEKRQTIRFLRPGGAIPRGINGGTDRA
jgi:hypothetical protein